MSETIMAAWIQAAGTFFPTAALAVAAVTGLMGWKKQLRGAKAVERAETCFDTAHEVADLIRAVRSPLVSIAAEDASTPDRRRAASNAIREEALNRAWASWRAFAC